MIPFVSILCSTRGNFNVFCASLETIIKTTDKKDAEILLKIDSDEDPSKYIKILIESGFEYKLLIYDRMAGYNDLHMFYTDLCKISVGNMLWIFYDDIKILTNNWVSELKLIYDIFDDNIVLCAFNVRSINKYGNFRKNKHGGFTKMRGHKSLIISRQWFECYRECLSAISSIDGYLSFAGSDLHRFLYSTNVNISTTITSKSIINARRQLPYSSIICDTNVDDHVNLIKLYMVDQKVILPDGIEYV